jgi:electron transfer flavoprotein beta subunit
MPSSICRDKKMTMNIIVCVKEVFDPEAPSEAYKIDSENKVLLPATKVVKVINPFDEQAVEAALRIKDKRQAKVTILSLGHNLDRVVVKKPLLMGADELFLLEDKAFEGGDSWSICHSLAAAIRKIGQYDLILCGRQSADWNSGLVGIGIAEILGLPSISMARKIDLLDGKAEVERVITNGYETVQVLLPAVITISNEFGQPRYPLIQHIRKSGAIRPTILKPADIGLEDSVVGIKGRKLELLKLFQPVYEGTCEIIDGETPQEAGEKLALHLRKEKIV